MGRGAGDEGIMSLKPAEGEAGVRWKGRDLEIPRPRSVKGRTSTVATPSAMKACEDEGEPMHSR